MPATANRHLQWLLGLLAVAAAARFPTLDVQSFWFDEAVTADLVRMPLGDMLAALPDSESTPPLYYLLIWVWSKLFGTGETGLRSLSALFGTATVLVAYRAGVEIISRRAGLVLAALAAVNPLLVWYSQEARAYALLTLLGGLSFLFFARARRDGGPRDLGLWAVASALALATHYFAVFLVVPEAIWLLGQVRTRATILAAAGVAAPGALLAPLALHQRSNAGAAFIEGSSLPARIVQVPKQYVVGFDAPVEILTTLIALALVLAGVGLLALRADASERRGAWLGALAGGFAIGLPALLSIIGVDYLLTRNVIAAWLPPAIVLAAGLGARRAGNAGVAVTTALCLLSAAIVVSVSADARFQREDWRGAARALGQAAGVRAIVVTPAEGRVPLGTYLRHARQMPETGTPVTEITFLGLAGRKPGQGGTSDPPRVPSLPAVPPAFRLVERSSTETFTLIRFRASTPTHVAPRGLPRLSAGAAAVLLEPARN